jgi:hypothetical protein
MADNPFRIRYNMKQKKKGSYGVYNFISKISTYKF